MTDHDFPRRRAATRNFRSGTPRNLSLARDGSDVLFVRSDSGTDPVNHLWRLSLDSGHPDDPDHPNHPGDPDHPGDTGEQKIADARELMGGADEHLPAEEQARRERLREASAGITSYSSDRNHTKACFALSGALWVHDVRSGHTYQKIGAGVTTPTVDPTGKRIAYTQGGSLYVISTGDDPSEGAVSLCESATESEIWGSADFIAAEEMGRYAGFWWSPHGKRLLVAQVDESSVDQWWISDPAKPEQQPRSTRYPAAGTTNASVRLFVVGLDLKRIEVVWDHDSFEYLARVNWTDESHPIVSVQSRDQQSAAILTVDPDTGDTTTASFSGKEPSIEVTSHADHAAAYSEATTPAPDPLTDPLSAGTPPTGEAQATSPTRPPWIDLIPGAPRHTTHGILDVVVDTECDTRRLVLLTDTRDYLTPPGLQVRAIQDADEGGVTLLASEDPTLQDLYRVGYSGHVECLSRPGGWSTGRSVGNTFTTSRADPDTASTAVTITAGDKHFALVNHSEDPGVNPRPEFIASGSAGLDTAILWPNESAEDTAGPLPIIMSPYGGPHAQRAIRAASAFVTEQWIADHGYCVVVSDGPGTPRSPSFEQSIHGDLARGALQGQVDALAAVVTRYGDRVDSDRVGIRGWSFGGYLAALAVLERPDLFHAAVAGAPVTDWALYDTHYTERYLGRPQDDPEAYRVSGLIDKAHKLTQPLLLIHGLSDDNVFAAHTLRLSSALLAAGRAHSVLPLTGVTHMTPQETVAENLLRLDFEFLREALGNATRTP